MFRYFILGMKDATNPCAGLLLFNIQWTPEPAGTFFLSLLLVLVVKLITAGQLLGRQVLVHYGMIAIVTHALLVYGFPFVGSHLDWHNVDTYLLGRFIGFVAEVVFIRRFFEKLSTKRIVATVGVACLITWII